MPITGPNSAPPIAAPSALPISSPRRATGASATIQARPPAHEQAPPRPSANRAKSSAAALSRNPNASVDPASSVSPAITATFGPYAGRQHPARKRPDQRPGGIRGGHRAGRQLRQVQLVGQVGQQRRDRGVEHRVHEHDRPDDQHQPALGGVGGSPHLRVARCPSAPRSRRCRCWRRSRGASWTRDRPPSAAYVGVGRGERGKTGLRCPRSTHPSHPRRPGGPGPDPAPVPSPGGPGPDPSPPTPTPGPSPLPPDPNPPSI